VNSRQTLAALWALAVAILGAWVAWQSAAGRAPDADFLALLPRAERAADVDAVVAQVQRRAERRLVLLVGGASAEQAAAVATEVRDRLLATGWMIDAGTAVPAADIGSAFLPHRFSLLAAGTVRRLEHQDEAGLARDAMRRLSSPGVALGAGLLDRDPLLLLPAFLEERAARLAGNSDIVGGWPIVHDGEHRYALVQLDLRETPFSLKLQEAVLPVLRQLRADLARRPAPAEVLAAGVVLHAATGSESARQEIAWIGGASLVAIVLIVGLAFRSPAPLVLSLLAGGVGCIAGYAACLAVFDRVHVFTLVFGTSLVGTAIDYPLHYFATRFASTRHWDPEDALRHTLPGLTLGLVTTLIGFAGLLLTGFPGLVQIALFSMSGLSGAFLCTVLWFPVLARPALPVPPGRLHRFADAWLAGWDRPRRRMWTGRAAVLLALAALVAGANLTANDDVRQFQARDPAVVHEEARVQRLLGQGTSTQFFIVRGATTDELLAREEALLAQLEPLQQEGRLGGTVALAGLVPSRERQEAALTLLRRFVASGGLERVATTIGLRPDAVAAYKNELADAVPLGAEQWLETPAGVLARPLWIGPTEVGVTSVVLLRGAVDTSAVAALRLPDGVVLADPVADVSRLFADYHRTASLFILAAYGAIAGLLALRYGWRDGLLLLVPPLAAVAACLSIFAAAGIGVSLFHVMAVLLVLGFGVDYTLFFREAGTEDRPAFIAVTFSALSTLLGFGLLALSQTAAVSAFGQTISIGIAVTFLLSPLARLAPGAALIRAGETTS